ncbi:MAG: ThiF family adenylyltransferase [Litoreibacter sp.]
MIDNVWLDEHAAVSIHPEDLNDPGLRALCALARRDDYSAVRFIETRRSQDESCEVVVLFVCAALGQKKTCNDVREIEPVAVKLHLGNEIPSVYPLRSDFPQSLPHMNLHYMDSRRSLCLFDAKASDVAHIYSPDMLIERVRWWMEESAHGDLHGNDQPLDPSLAPSFFDLILPRDFDQSGVVDYTAVRISGRPFSPIEIVRSDQIRDDAIHKYGCSAITTSPINHGTMLDLPSNMAELIETYGTLGVDLKVYVNELLGGDLNAVQTAKLVRSDLLLIIETPLLRPGGGFGGISTRAFLSRNTSLLEIGELLGLVAGAGDKVAKLLIPADSNTDGLAQKSILPLNVVQRFSTDSARRSSGLTEFMETGYVAIGAGALGSQVINNCARMGLNDWVIIDSDFIMPHNLARHDASDWHIGQSKAEVMSHSIDTLFGDTNTQALHEYLGIGTESDDLTQVLTSERQVVDLSAALDVSRGLAERDDIIKPIVSYFANPEGTALIELREGADRSANLTDVEMAYYWALYEMPELHDHLKVGEMVHIGSCREASVTIPQYKMAMFAAIASGCLVDQTVANDGQFKIWTVSEDSTVGLVKKTVPVPVKCNHDEWQVSVAPEVLATIDAARRAAENIETGGILLGGCDRKNNRIFISGAMMQPNDSKAGASYFERGGRGVEQMIMNVEQRTMKHLTYVGEWHTHPKGSGNQPSDDDDNLLAWIAERRGLFVMPGIMLILGDNGFRLRTATDASSIDSTF